MMNIAKIMSNIPIEFEEGIGSIPDSISFSQLEKLAIEPQYVKQKNYIVSGELIPESNNLYKGRINSIGNIIGFLIGMIATLF